MNPSARMPGEPASYWGWDESAVFQNSTINRGVEWDWTYYSENPLVPHFGLRGGGLGGAEAELKPQILVGAAPSSSSSLSQIMLNSAGLRGIGAVPWSHGSLRDIVMKRDPEDLQATIGLNLGARTYFSSSAPGNSFCKRPRANSPGSAQIPRCQAEGCKANLMNAKHYHRRHRVCELHSKASTVTAGGLIQRFCQQCSRFHVISEFDEGKRSCRKRLADHNRRRRKRPPAVINEPAPPEANSSSHSAGPAIGTPILRTADDNQAKAPPEDGGRTGERYSQGITPTAPHLSAVPFVAGLIGNQLASGLDVWLKPGASSSEFAGSVDIQTSSSLPVVESSCRSSSNFEAFPSDSSQVLDHPSQISSAELIAGGSEWNIVRNLCESSSRNYNAAQTQVQYRSRDPNLQQRPPQVLSFHSYRDFIPRAANEIPSDTKRAA